MSDDFLYVTSSVSGEKVDKHKSGRATQIVYPQSPKKRTHTQFLIRKSHTNCLASVSGEEDKHKSGRATNLFILSDEEEVKQWEYDMTKVNKNSFKHTLVESNNWYY